MKNGTTPQLQLRFALEQLISALEAAFADGQIHSEWDVNCVVVSHLKASLCRKRGLPMWVIGANHCVDSMRPDVCCYFVEGEFGPFVAEKEKYLVGVVEIKFAAGLKADLKKLARYQTRRPHVIAWMVYGDHFCEDIHEHYGREGVRRMKQIDDWVRVRPQHRGRSILKCGTVRSRFRSQKELISGFNENFWIRDHE